MGAATGASVTTSWPQDLVLELLDRSCGLRPAHPWHGVHISARAAHVHPSQDGEDETVRTKHKLQVQMILVVSALLRTMRHDAGGSAALQRQPAGS
jgi:hypothetical protein